MTEPLEDGEFRRAAELLGVPDGSRDPLTFPVYGLASFDGPRVLEGETWVRTRREEVALGDGLRWTRTPWLEVCTFHPEYGWPSVHDEEEICARIWCNSDGDELEVHDLENAGQIEFELDGIVVAPAVLRFGEIHSCATRATTGSVVLVTWVHRWPGECRQISPVEDLTAYRKGLAADLPRRRVRPVVEPYSR